MDDAESEPMFTCKDCGAHELVVVREFTITTHYTDTLPCYCAWNKTHIAAKRRYALTPEFWEIGYLDEQHRWEWLDDLGNDPYNEPEVEEEELEVVCDACLEEAEEEREEDWETDPDTTTDERDLENAEYYVRCAGCDREIEFGWSFAERRGRIWPVECSDFDPQRCWPEPRYRESWVAKGWLHSST